MLTVLGLIALIGAWIFFEFMAADAMMWFSSDYSSKEEREVGRLKWWIFTMLAGLFFGMALLWFGFP